MKTTNHLIFFAGLLALTISQSCQKVINLNLNAANPKVVIEGEINEGRPPHLLLSQTVNFSDSIYFKGVRGAFITVADVTSGVTDTLIMEPVAGVYDGSKAFGWPGHTYKLTVQSGGQIYIASSTMPDQVTLDSAYAISFGGFGGDKNLVIVPKFTQPATGKHYYRFNYSTNNQMQPGLYLGNNLINPGQVSTRPLGGRDGAAIVKPGDQVELVMRCIDEPVYNYFITLSQNTNDQSATPANPVSNISNGALGYFSANTIQYYTFLVR
jgi:hypothetical protein